VDGPVDLPDVNVWLALSLPDHPHHGRAHRFWRDESGREVAFCRVTALGFLRLLTLPAVMGGKPLGVPEAWRAYDSLRRLPEVVFAAEPGGCEALLKAWATAGDPTPRLWTDAYLAAFARAGGFRLVSFDRDFNGFAGLDLLWLRA
jgi:uncharacterized protein